jgi:hypothetical protein
MSATSQPSLKGADKPVEPSTPVGSASTVLLMLVLDWLRLACK